MRVGAAVALLIAAGSARAEPRIETGAFLGVDDFGDNKIRLGNGTEPEQRPQTAAMFGLRGTLLFLHAEPFELGFEPEVGLTFSWTGYGFDGPRDSYFAPVLAYRGSLIGRFTLPYGFSVHALAGAGGESVFSSSPYIVTATDPLFYYGVGGAMQVGDGWQARVDLRQGWMPDRDGGYTPVYQAMVGFGFRFGEHAVVHPIIETPPPPVVVVAPPKPVEPPPVVVVEPPKPVEPPPPPPDPDLDHDGILNAVDKCPMQPETVNGFDDEDGCPDELPPAVVAAFATASAVRFEPGRARLTEAAKTSLVKLLDQLRAHPGLHVEVVAHPDKRGDKPAALAKKRGDVVKWYLVDQGVPADQIDAHVDADIATTRPKTTPAPIEVIATPRHAAPAPTPDATPATPTPTPPTTSPTTPAPTTPPATSTPASPPTGM
ncbi:MAG: OmpA family protein [Kofleriaceae bacterium]